jgi:hypothetical protein
MVQGVKLKSVVRSKKAGKKWDFIFIRDNGRTFTRSIGDSSMEDFTQHKDTQRRANYRSRHSKDLGTGDPTRAGFISYYVLWGNSSSFRDNLASYKSRFGL